MCCKAHRMTPFFSHNDFTILFLKQNHSTIHMIIQPSHSISPGQPIFEFLLQISNRYEALEPAIRERIEEDLNHIIHLIGNINRAHAEQYRIRNGNWYLRHRLVAADQEVTVCAKNALDAVLKMKDEVAENGINDHGLEELVDYAIAFAQSICDEPRILSIETPSPSSSVHFPDEPQI